MASKVVPTAIKRWLMAVSVMVLGGGISAYASGINWKEEVRLHDGGRIVVERSVARKGRHEPFQQPSIGEQSLSFVPPATHQRVRWEDVYSEDIGSANFLPMMLEIDKGTAYLVASPMGCLSYNKWGRPNPPYVVFKYQDGGWRRIVLQELPARFKTPNLIISSPDDAVWKAGLSLVPAERVQEFNAGFKQPEYRTILREPLKPGALDCPVMVRIEGGWRSPGEAKWPIPIKPSIPNESNK